MPAARSKADEVRAWLAVGNLTSKDIAMTVGCHSGFVRAVKQRMLHPERERARNHTPRRVAARKRMDAERHARVRADPELYARRLARNSKSLRLRLDLSAEYRARYLVQNAERNRRYRARLRTQAHEARP